MKGLVKGPCLCNKNELLDGLLSIDWIKIYYVYLNQSLTLRLLKLKYVAQVYFNLCFGMNDDIMDMSLS